MLIETRREENMEQIEKLAATIKGDFLAVEARRSVGVGNLHGQLKSAEIKLAAVEADVKTTQRGVDRLETKLDHVVDRVADKVEAIINNIKPGGK